MEFRQLKYFIQIANDQNYTIASKKLYITQPTLSWTIKQLEEELGVKLFNHSGKKLALTPSGEDLLQHANHLLNEQQKVLEFFQNQAPLLSGHLKIGIPELFASCFFMDTIMNFMDNHAKIKITMTNNGSIAVQKMVEAEELDMGIISYLFPSDTLDVIEVPINYPQVLIVSTKHKLANRASVSFADLRNESFILLTEDFTLGKLPLQSCLNLGFTPNVVLRSSEWDVICGAVASSNNISFLPYQLVTKLPRKDLAVIPIEEDPIPIGIITKRNRPKSLPLQKFIQFLLDHILNNPQEQAAVKIINNAPE